jgi:hypothetical protein
LIIQSEQDGSITISDDKKPIYNIKAKLEFKRDSGHGGGIYVNDVTLEVRELKAGLNKKDYIAWKDRIESGR